MSEAKNLHFALAVAFLPSLKALPPDNSNHGTNNRQNNHRRLLPSFEHLIPLKRHFPNNFRLRIQMFLNTIRANRNQRHIHKHDPSRHNSDSFFPICLSQELVSLQTQARSPVRGIVDQPTSEVRSSSARRATTVPQLLPIDRLCISARSAMSASGRNPPSLASWVISSSERVAY